MSDGKPEDGLFIDIEVYHEFFYLGMKRISDGKRNGIEMSSRVPDTDVTLEWKRTTARKWLLQYMSVGFNSLSYDLALIWYWIEGASNEDLKRASDAIIEKRIPWWEVEDFLEIRIPWKIKNQHIDLIEPQPNPFASLKTLNGRLHGKQMQDLPFDPKLTPTPAQMQILADYCLHSDLDATENLWVALADEMHLRERVSEQIGFNVRSKSDTQMGLKIIEKRVEAKLGHKVPRSQFVPGQTFKYTPPSFVRFNHPHLREIHKRIADHTFTVGGDGKVELPFWLRGKEVSTLKAVNYYLRNHRSNIAAFTAKQIELSAWTVERTAAKRRADEWAITIKPTSPRKKYQELMPTVSELLNGLGVEHDVDDDGYVILPFWYTEKITVGASTYTMGIGGLHSTESNRAVRSSNTHALCDFDVASYYPAIILNAGLYPAATGPAFLEVYADIRAERIAAKKAKDKVTDKSLKIALNGTFGSLGSPHKFVYAPHLMIHVTLTGQLCLLMLIEWAEEMGISCVSGNTDGVVMMIPREMWAGLTKERPNPSPLADLIERWEAATGFDLEGTEYSGLFNLSVNSYYAIKPDGSHKRKGPLANPWNTDPADFDPRTQMMKNPAMTICSDAALAKIKHGTPVEETIRACTDIRQFVGVVKADGGATWNGEYLGKVVRYYWGTNGHEIHKPKGKVPKTDGAVACMRLPDEFPYDIDYARYVKEAEAILRDVGFYGDYIPTGKKVRTNKSNRRAVDTTWLLAA